YVHFKNEKDEVKFFFPVHENDPWEMFLWNAKDKKFDKKKSNDTEVEALVAHLVGKNAIVDFVTLDPANKDKQLADWGLKKSSAEVEVYINAIDRPKQDPKDLLRDLKDKEKDKDKDKMPELKKQTRP